MARLHTRSELARLAGVSPAAITKACRASLADACAGKRIDLDHPSVASYLEEKGVDPTADPPPARSAPKKATKSRPRSGAAKPKKKASPKKGPKKTARRGRQRPKVSRSEVAPEGAGEVLRTIEGLEHLTLEELVRLHGTVITFKDWLDARKKIADLRNVELKNATARAQLIPRDLVRAHVFGAIDACNRRLLGDSAKTIARRVMALAKSSASVEEAEATVRDLISSQLRPMKAAAKRSIRNA